MGSSWIATKPGKTVTRSFRINESAFDAIKEEAERRNISVNTFVNQILMTYANFDRYLDTVRMMKVPTSVLRQIVEAVPEEKLVEVGKPEISPTQRIAYHGT